MRPYKTRLYCPSCNDSRFEYLQHCISAQHRAYNIYLEFQLGTLKLFCHYFPNGSYRRYKKSLTKQQKIRISKVFFTSAYGFSRIFTKLKESKYFSDEWMVDVPRHTINQGFKNAETAFKRYWRGIAGKPRFKGGRSRRSCYFDGAIHVKRDRIKLPKVGWLRLSRYGYIPTDEQLAREGKRISCAYVSQDADYYYVSVVTNEDLPQKFIPRTQLHGHYGIDLGIKDEAIVGHKHYPNLTKTPYYHHMVNCLHRWQRRMSRRWTRGSEATINFLKAKYHVKRWFRKVRCFMHNYIRQVTTDIIKRLKPKSLTIENLNIKGMKHNHKLSNAIQPLDWYYFDKWLVWLGDKYKVQVRQVSRYFPSTKLCCHCHRYNHTQFHGTLNDLNVRTIHCPYCGATYDRDEGASINLANCQQYKVLTTF